jgi:hypothetical protein
MPKYGSSLAFAKFQSGLEQEIASYWHVHTALIYSERWWNEQLSQFSPSRITQYGSDECAPFQSIDISPAEYINRKDQVIEKARENAVVNFVTSFEVYLYDIIQRLIFLNPELLDESKIHFNASDISRVVGKVEMLDWFSQKIADKFVRGGTHFQIIGKVEKLAKAGISKRLEPELEEWNRWTYVRNSIVHGGRTVTEDLRRIWPERYASSGSALVISDRDISRVHSLALKIALELDRRAMDSVIEYQDAQLLTKEFFTRTGNDSAREIAIFVMDRLGCKLKRPLLEKALAEQKRTSGNVSGFTFPSWWF